MVSFVEYYIYDIITFTTFGYSICGNYKRYFNNKKKWTDEIKMIDGKTSVKLIQPLYYDNGTFVLLKNNGNNILIEIGSIVLLKNTGDDISIKHAGGIYDTIDYENPYYLNNNRDFSRFCIKNGFSTYSLPISLPCRVYEKKINVPIYYNSDYGFRTNKKIFTKGYLRFKFFNNRLPLTFTAIGATSFVLLFRWLLPEYSWIPIFKTPGKISKIIKNRYK